MNIHPLIATLHKQMCVHATHVRTYLHAYPLYGYSVLALSALVIAGGLWFFVFTSEEQPETVAPIRDTFVLGSNLLVSSSITLSGTLEPVTDTILSAEASGTITLFPYHAGDTVGAHALIMRIEQKDAYAQVLVADALVAEAQAHVDKIKNGTREEQLAVLAETVTQTKRAQETADTHATQALHEAYATIDSTFPGGVDALFTDANGVNPTLSFTTTQNASKIQAQNKRVGITDILKRHTQKNVSQDIGAEIRITQSELTETKETLDALLRALDGAVPSTEAPQTTLDTYTSIATARRTSVLGSIASLTNAETARTDAQSAYTIAIEKQKEGVTGARAEDVQSAEAALARAPGARASAYAQFAHTEVRAPFSGVISDTYVTLGERVSPGTPIARIASEGGWKIILSAPDTYNESLTVGMPVRITLRGTEGVFSGSIVRIIPAIETGTRKVRFEVAVDALPASARTGMISEATLSFGDVTVSNTSSDTYEVPHRFVGYDYEGAFVIANNERVFVHIDTQGTDTSRIQSSALSNSMILTHPHEYTPLP